VAGSSKGEPAGESAGRVASSKHAALIAVIFQQTLADSGGSCGAVLMKGHQQLDGSGRCEQWGHTAAGAAGHTSVGPSVKHLEGSDVSVGGSSRMGCRSLHGGWDSTWCKWWLQGASLVFKWRKRSGLKQLCWSYVGGCIDLLQQQHRRIACGQDLAWRLGQ
jgi:hypothetical protein